ncbi:MAG: ABC transporter permease [Planctomycetota bacterium]|nr:ABC transporter permease [Planctomycetota bacterium]
MSNTPAHTRPGSPRVITHAAALLRPFLALIIVGLVFFLIQWHKLGYTTDPTQLARMVTVMDLRMVAIQTVIVGTAAIGMTLVIASGGLDLSVGSAVALCSVVGAMAVRDGWPIALAAGAAVLVGAACGMYNGLLITILRLPPFIVTLGTLGLFRGVAKWIAGGMPVSADPGWLAAFVSPVPSPGWLVVAPGVWLMLALALVAAFALRRTVLGRHTIAVGSNELAAKYAGVHIARTKIMVYVSAGLFVGLAGLLQFARLTQGDPTVAIGIELDVIAAVVIGGASLSGGRGSVLGALVGAFMMAYMKNRCVRLGWPSFVQEMIVGHIIIIAVAIDLWRQRREAAA